ncbi:hypothetical protein TYRP_018609 [Tyrophagus putrescentiae]|nr:hypothetical protein TYRP_018609 [Tyrophagus putrescentiae]
MPNSSPIYLEVDDIFAIGAEQTSRRKSFVSKDAPSTNCTSRAIATFMEAVGKMNEAVLVPSKLRDIEVPETDVSSLMPLNSDLFSFYTMLNTVRHELFSNNKYQNAFGVFPASGSNSGQNSGRVTPTGGLSRRASAINMYGTGTGGGSPLASPTSPVAGNGRMLAPPATLSFERKLSNSSSFSGDLLSPELSLSLAVGGGCANGNGNGASNGNGFLSPSSPVPLSLGSRTASLSSLLAAIGLDDGPDGPIGCDDRVAQITSCFMHHLTALYTILGHFTRAANYITRRYKEETEDIF